MTTKFLPFVQEDFSTPRPYGVRFSEETRELVKASRRRCQGCGRFLSRDARWSQCADCDERTPEDIGYGR